MSRDRNKESRLTKTGSGRLKVARAFREFAGAFSHLADFRSFFEYLESSLERTELFDEATLRLVKNTDEAGSEQDGGLFMPLSSEFSENLLVLKEGAGSRTFGAEDLHLMAALGDLIASMSVQARRMSALKRKVTILDLLLGRLPVGVIVCAVDHRVLSWNQRATDFLGTTVKTGEPFDHGVFQGACSGKERLRDHSFYFNTGNKALYVECCHAVGTSLEDGALVYVLADLSHELREFGERFSREFYRCGWLAQPMSLILMRLAGDSVGVMKVLARVREGLGNEIYAGVHSDDTIGVVASGKKRLEASRLLRRAMNGIASEGLRVSVTEVDNADRQPEEMLTRAEAQLVPSDDWIRRSILIYDGSKDVTDTLDYVLSGEYRIVKCDRFETALQRVGSDVFDGLITEIESRDGRSGLELARFARRHHPKIRTFLTTTGRIDHTFARAKGIGERPVVIQKPFNVKDLRERVRAGFS